MLKKIIFCAFILSCTSSVRAMEEDSMDVPSRYLVILQKAYQGDPKSINGLHNALKILKERSHPDDYKGQLSQLYNQALNLKVSSETFAKRIKKFIIDETHRLCPSSRTDFNESFHRALLASLIA